MRIPQLIGAPMVIALATVDAVLELQIRTVRALTRVVMRQLLIDSPTESLRS